MITPAPKRPRKPAKKSSGLPDWAANTIIGVVTGVWATSVIAGMFSWNGYQPPEAIHTIFLVIVGGTFVLRNKGKDDE